MKILNTQENSFSQPVSTIGGTSDQWNSTYATICATSATAIPNIHGLQIYNSWEITPEFIKSPFWYPFQYREIPAYNYGMLYSLYGGITDYLYETNYSGIWISGSLSIPNVISFVGANASFATPGIGFRRAASSLVNIPVSAVTNGDVLKLPKEINCNVEGTDIGSGITINSMVTLTAIKFPELAFCGSGISFDYLPGVTTIEFPKLKYFALGGYAGISLGNTGSPFPVPSVSSISLPEVEMMGSLTLGGYFLDIGSGYGVAGTRDNNFFNIDTPKLRILGGCSIGGSTLANTNTFYPRLTSISSFVSNIELLGGFSSSFFQLRQTGVSAINFPKLEKMVNSTFDLDLNFQLKELILPALKFVVGGYFIQTMSSTMTTLSSLSAPNIEICTAGVTPAGSNFGIAFQSGTGVRSISSLDFGTETMRVLTSRDLTFNTSLDQASVDRVFKMLSRLDGTNNTMRWEGENVPNTLPAGTFSYTRTVSIGGANRTPSYTGGVTTTSAGTNFSRTGTTVTANVVSHGHNNGDLVTFTGNTVTALNGTYVVTVITTDQFQYTTFTSGATTGGGTVTMRRTTVSTDGFRYYQEVARRRNVTVTANLP